MFLYSILRIFEIWAIPPDTYLEPVPNHNSIDLPGINITQLCYLFLQAFTGFPGIPG